MGFLLSILVGALVGWLASMVMKTNAQQGILLNIVVGVVGGFVGTWLFAGVLHIGSAAAAGTFTVVGVAWSVAGACSFIGLLKLIRVLR